MRKIGGGGLLGLMVLFLIAMAMPWAVVSCESMELLEQSGFQVATGEVEPGKDMATLMKNMEEMGDVDELEDASGDIDGAVWLWIALAGSLAAGVGGLLLLTGKGPGAMLGLGGGAVALIVLLASFGIGFPIEADSERKNAEAAEEAEGNELGEFAKVVLKVDRRGGFWLAVVASAGQLAFAALALRGSKGAATEA